MTEEEIISIVLDICIYKGDNDGLSKKEYQAIQGLVDLYNKEKEKSQKQDTEINKLNKRISDLEFALIDMVYQFADESENQLNTMGLSALETAFCELDFDNPIDKDIVIKKFEELYKKYINNK